MARTPTSPARTIRARLTTGETALRQQADSLASTDAASADEVRAAADAIAEVLAPNGWGLLRRAETLANPGSASKPNLPIFMNKEIRETIKSRNEARREALKSKAEAKAATLSADVDEGFRKFLSGEFTPDAPIRSRRNSGAEKGNLNVRPDPGLVQQVKDLADAKSAEYGWTVTPARVATAYLMKKYRISEAAQAK
ncbi:hypothetical protein AB0E67_27560 [Streptomyces sp. NPDC032161]|uniref:hypothetical protein n=1 Tax=unclassified Streptomyces TaxID=2593676 RepID=UPI0033E56865